MTWKSSGLLVSLLTAALAQPIFAQKNSGITSERLTHAEDEPENWLMYNGQYSRQRYSRLVQIDKSNVGKLQVNWIYQLRTLSDVETSPLVVDGIMYLTQSPSNVIALDGATGRPFGPISMRCRRS